MPVKLVVAGIGGVGGYYGGLLSRFSESHRGELEVSFIARGAHMQKMKADGLTVIAEKEQFITRPHKVTDRPEEIGTVDYVIVATKSYDLEEIAQNLRPVVGPQTIILPLLNGIDSVGILRAIYPQNEIWYGCAYIIARLNEPGVIESSGNVHYLHFGHEKMTSPELKFMEDLFLKAGIEATLKVDAIRAIWRKFFFISTTAALTTYLNTGFRDLVWNPEYKSLYLQLMQELLLLADAEKVGLKPSLIDDMLRYGGSLPEGTTSSMNSDYLAGKRIELDTLIGVVVRMATGHRLDVPLYSKIYEALKK